MADTGTVIGGSAAEGWPLSAMQRSMLFRSLAAPEGGYYIQQWVWHSPGPLRDAALQRAWEMVAARHDALRAFFRWKGKGEPRQFFGGAIPVPVEIRDIEADPTARAAVIDDFLQADRTRGFDLAEPPLWRVTLFRWEDGSFVGVWSFHHLLLDGRSHGLVFKEWSEAYDALCNRRLTEFPPAYRFSEFL